MKQFFVYSFVGLAVIACKEDKTSNTFEHYPYDVNSTIDSISGKKTDYKERFQNHAEYRSDGFDFPVGKPNGQGYYNAQKFQENNHLGEDWNGNGGGNSDLGDAIYAIANGYISEVKDYGGSWGNVVRIVHLYNDNLYESLYAHCDTTLVSESVFIKKGEQIATIGNCYGLYLAHLHFEIRDDINLPIGPGYSTDTTGYVNPTDFINTHRN